MWDTPDDEIKVDVIGGPARDDAGAWMSLGIAGALKKGLKAYRFAGALRGSYKAVDPWLRFIALTRATHCPIAGWCSGLMVAA